MTSTETSKRKRIISKLTLAANKAVKKSKGKIQKFKEDSVRPLKELPNHLSHLETEFQPTFD